MIDEPLPAGLCERLILNALDHAPREIVGYVVYPWDLVFVPNIATNPNLFEVADDVQLQVYQNYGRRLKGMFHSHPAGRREPSNLDVQYAPVNLRYWIITPTEVTEWDLDYDPPIERIFASSPGLATPAPARGAEDGR